MMNRCLALLLTLVPAVAQAQWWDPAWNDRTELLFDTTAFSNDHGNFTLLVRLDSSRIDYSRLQTNGEDLRFIDADDATELSYEIENWDPTGTSTVWVKVPLIDGNSTTDKIYLYFDNPSAADNQNDVNTWSGNTEVVYHFDHGTPIDVISGLQATLNGSSRATAVHGDGRDFDGTEHVTHSADLDTWLSGTASLSTWIWTTDTGQPDATDAVALTGQRRNNSTSQLHAWGWLETSGGIGIRVGGSGDSVFGTTVVNDGQWHHVVVQRNSGTGLMRVFVDGVLDASVTGGTGDVFPEAPYTDIAQIVGAGSFNSSELNATLDEFRIRSSFDSPDRILADYLSQTDAIIDWCTPVDWYADTDGDTFGDPLNVLSRCTQPVDYVADATDCDDSDPAVNPGANEVCDSTASGVDEDCDGFSDDADPEGASGTTLWFDDMDSDGYGDPATGVNQCDPSPMQVADSLDCDDTNPAINPLTTWYRDSDGDGYGDPGDTRVQCDQPSNYVLDNTDCNDNNAALNPATPWYRDADGDGYGTPLNVVNQCTQPAGYVADDQDCNDGDPTVNPDLLWFADTDGDGFGDPGSTTPSCTQPFGYVADNTDCDDTDSTVNPNTSWFEDADGDGYGNPGTSVQQCTDPSTPGNAYASNNDDCDDSDPTLNPDTVWYHDADGDGYGDPLDPDYGCTSPGNHVANSDDCDDTDAAVTLGPVWFPDNDNDGYGDAAFTSGDQIQDCTQPAGYAPNYEDCDDGNALINPGVLFDACEDGVDSDCDGIGGPLSDEDGDGLIRQVEDGLGASDCTTDSDGDIALDIDEYIQGDTDGDGIPNIVDTDDDNDGLPSLDENGEGIVESDSAARGCSGADGLPDYLDTDADGDGLLDGTCDFSVSPPVCEDAVQDDDADGIKNFQDCDSSGCAGDTDGDGIANCDEVDVGTFPINPDSDGDGIDDLTELGGNPTALVASDFDGDGVIDALDDDDDDDGVLTLTEDSDGDGSAWGDDVDGDGAFNHLDIDDDGDGVDTALEDSNGDGQVGEDDHDGDGLPDFLDDDDDDDGLPTADEDANLNGNWWDDDTDGDGVVNYLDDMDWDGPTGDPDQDGLGNEDETLAGSDDFSSDSDGDGVLDGDEFQGDSDGDGLWDPIDDDDDGDGIPTAEEGNGDLDGDGIPNHLDDDSDGDGIPDAFEAGKDEDCDGVMDAFDANPDGRCTPEASGNFQIYGYESPQCGHADGPTWPWLALLAMLGARRRSRDDRAT